MNKALVYHTIGTPEIRLPTNIDISPNRFEAHLRWLAKRRRRVVPLRKFLSISEKENLWAITFDDGFRDNLTVALPLLEKYNLPMTIFVVADFVGKKNYLTLDDLKVISDHQLITIGSHGYSHRHFTKLSDKEVNHEFIESRNLLENITGDQIDLFAYPYGDCNERIENLCRKSGYTAAWSVWNGKNTAFSRWRVPLGTFDNVPRLAAKLSPLYFPVKNLIKPAKVEVKNESLVL